MSARSATITLYLGRIILLAGAYYVTGQLGLWLAIPPGFATAVWPPSGLALAALLLLGSRYWPGVFFGSFSINVFLAFDVSSTAAIVTSVAIATTIALGASLQTVASAVLIRRFVAFPSALEAVKDIAILLTIGGPVGCLINATIGPTTLAVLGVTSWQEYGFNWFTWWVGDAIGVIAFTPLLLLFTRDAAVARARKIVVTASMLVVLGLTVYVFFSAKDGERRRQQLAFEQRTTEITVELQKNIATYLNVLVAIDSYFRASEHVTYDEFKVFTRKFFALYPGIQALSWNQGITDAERDAYEAAMHDQGYAEFSIKDQVSPDSLGRAPRRERYFPVTYIVPYERNQKALGFDTYGATAITSDQRRQTLDAARDAGAARTTGRISLVQDDRSQNGLLIYHPIYDGAMPPDSMADRRTHLIGYTAGVFLLPDMVQTTVHRARQYKIDWVLRDLSMPEGTQWLYDSRTPDHQESLDPLALYPTGLQWTARVAIAGHTWEVQFLGGKAYFGTKPSWHLWTVLVGGLLYTGLSGAFLLTVTARTEVVQRLVDEKTAELSERNLALQTEINVRKQTEEALSTYALNLERSNKELDDFAYVASHDLRSPLRGIDQLATWVIEDASEQLPDGAREDLELIRQRIARMDGLLDDLLQYSRIGHRESVVDSVSTEHLVKEAIDLYSLPSGFVADVVAPMPVLQAPQPPLALVFRNLIDNAVQHHDREDGKIQITGHTTDTLATFTVSDDGPGIPCQYHEQIFGLFQTLKPRDGVAWSGMGLAFVKKTVELHGGTVWVESDGERGTRFMFTWPLRS